VKVHATFTFTLFESRMVKEQTHTPRSSLGQIVIGAVDNLDTWTSPRETWCLYKLWYGCRI